MKFLGLNVKEKERNKANVSLNKDSKIQFQPRENANILKTLYSKLATDLVKNSQLHLINSIAITTLIYITIKETNFSYSTYPKMLLKALSCLDMNKAARMDQIPAKFLKEVAGVLAYPLSRIIIIYETNRISRRM